MCLRRTWINLHVSNAILLTASGQLEYIGQIDSTANRVSLETLTETELGVNTNQIKLNKVKLHSFTISPNTS
ncbi:uncharacterized protein J3R85_006363 [Psidium guajava]|nr:uncharacterized protein J3R85_006363 [Psidium guajava]